MRLARRVAELEKQLAVAVSPPPLIPKVATKMVYKASVGALCAIWAYFYIYPAGVTDGLRNEEYIRYDI